jgi:hypothetical protein
LENIKDKELKEILMQMKLEQFRSRKYKIRSKKTSVKSKGKHCTKKRNGKPGRKRWQW